MKKFLSAFAVVFCLAAVCSGSTPGPISSLREVHALTNAQAAQSPAVAFEATVTYFRGYEKTLFVEDQDVAIYVSATTELNLLPGDRILIRGTAHDSFRPFVASSDITLLRHDSLPPPLTAGFADLVQARMDCMYVTVRGVVGSAEMQLSSGRAVTQIELRMDGGYIGVIIDNSDPAKLKGLLDAEVEISGVASGRFDGKMQQTGALIHTTDFGGVKILSAAQVDAWDTPLARMDEVLSALNTRELTQRVRVEGTITYYHPASMAILQNGSRSIRVLTQAINPLRVGDGAEAIGIPFIDNGFLTLKLGQIRSTGAAAPIVPVPVTWDDLASGKHSFDLVSIEGKVVSQVREQAQDVYIISAGDRPFSAAVLHPFVYEWGVVSPPPPMPDIAPGSMVRVTGVAILDDGNPFNGAVAFGILLRSVSDVSVVERPPLLNVRNLILLVILLLAVVVTGGSRGWAIERKMRRQTAALAYVERRRGRILEDINGSRPLAEVIAEITELVSFRMRGAPCWCRIADGMDLGNHPPRLDGLRIRQHEIPSHSGASLGTVSAAFHSKDKPAKDEAESLSMAASLASLAIETRKLYTDLRHRSEFDLLTGVHNRFSLENCLDARILETRQDGGMFGLIYIDLDDFKQINDLHGHQVGDRYLQEVALRMKQQLRDQDLLARIGGDEFVALAPLVHSRADVEEIALRLERCFDEPFRGNDISLRGSASIGFALYPEDGDTNDALFIAADVAMYATKNRKREIEAALNNIQGSEPAPQNRA